MLREVRIVHRMDEPTHANESRFWDDVADWLLDLHEQHRDALTDAQIEAMLRALPRDRDAP